MNIPYRTRRKLKIFGTIAMVLTLIFCVTWLCWVIWLQRYVVYTDEGASLDFNRSANEIVGEVPKAPVASMDVSIYYNEGANAIDTEQELTKLRGYFITNDDLVKTPANVEKFKRQIQRLDAGTPVMIEMKGPFGSFFYQSKLEDAQDVISQSTDLTAMSELVDLIKTKGCYAIAQVSAFRDRSFGVDHVSSGLYMLNRKGLWMDKGGMYWLDPTNATAISWIISVVLELKEMGFNEVMLADFCFPDTDQIIFNGDKTEALVNAANKLMTACCAEGDNFTLSFCVTDSAFPLPEGRCRMYLQDVNASEIGAIASKAEFEDAEARLVFLCSSGDTRYDEYGVLRSMSVADEVEARKANQSE